MQCHVAGGRGQVPVVVAAAVALTGLVALVSCGLRQLLRFCLQQFVQRFLNAPAHQFLDLPLDYSLVQCYNLLRHGPQAPFECVCTNSILSAA